MFISIVSQGEGYWDIAWILSREDQLEVQRQQYGIKPMNEVFEKSPDAYFPTYAKQTLERTLSLYNPVLVVSNQKQAADIMDGLGIPHKAFSELTLLDGLARARSVSMEDLYQRAGEQAPAEVLPAIRLVEAVKTCYFELVGRNLTVGGYVKQWIEISGKRVSGLGVPSTLKQVSGQPETGNNTFKRNDQKGCVGEIWDFFIKVLGWFFLVYFGMILLMLLIQGIEYIISQFR